MKAGSVCNDGSGFAPIEMNEVFSAAEGHELDIGGVFDYTYEVAGKAA